MLKMTISGNAIEWITNYANKGAVGMENNFINKICPMLEQYAKAHAPWIDQTGNARRGLHSFYTKRSQYTHVATLSHGVDYGKFLELCNSGRYAVLRPTVDALLPNIMEECIQPWR